MNPKISVVIPTYNRLELLKKCVNSLLNQSFKSYEIIIIDDGSIDGTKEYLDKISGRNQQVRIVHQPNKGYGVSRNEGFRIAKGDFIVSTDDDCIVEKDWLTKIYNVFIKYPDISAVGGSIINPTDTKIAWAQYILNYSSWFPIGKARLVKDIPTANIAYRKKSIIDLKFRSLNKNAGYTDSVFNFELRKKGGKILFDPSIRVFHLRWEFSDSYDEFLKIQKRKSIGFFLHGYKIHGFYGTFLRKFPFLYIIAPRLFLIFLRCFKANYLGYFFCCFNLIIRGELEFLFHLVKFLNNS